MRQMNHRTDELSKEEERMKRTTWKKYGDYRYDILIQTFMLLSLRCFYQRWALGI